MCTHVVARLGGLFTAMSALFLSTASAVDITVDMTTPYQRMEGFGVLGRMKPWKIRQGPFLIDVDLDAVGIYDSLVSELGATLFRTDLTGKVQPDSGVWDFSVLQGQHEPFYTLRRFREAAERHNEPIYLFGHVWSPPGWMKVCGTEECPGGVARSDCALKDGYQDDLGRHLLRLVRTFHDSTGIEHYAVSVQDEPSFQHAFASCVYTGQTYVQALKGVASVFRENSYSMRFFGAEHVAGEYPTEYDRAVRADPVALEYLYAWAVHGYYSEDLWRRAYADTGSYNGSTPTQKPFWVTTHSGFGTGLNDWPEAMRLARTIWSMLYQSKASLYVWYNPNANADDVAESGCCLMVNGQRTAKYHVQRHYWRFIRPGARHVASTSSDTSVRVVAFNHDENECVTIILVNNAESVKAVNGVSGAGIPARLKRIVSIETAKRLEDSVSASANIELPAKSITTLVAGEYRGTGYVSAGPPPVSAVSRKPARKAGRVRVYGLNGRLLMTRQGQALQMHGTRMPARRAAGVYQVVVEGLDGVRVRRMVMEAVR